MSDSKPKGMTEEQKKEVRKILDTFKEKAKTCLLCEKKTDDYITSPEIVNNRLELHVYGLCVGHSISSQAEMKANKEIAERKKDLKDEVENPKLTIIFFSDDGQEHQVKHS